MKAKQVLWAGVVLVVGGAAAAGAAAAYYWQRATAVPTWYVSGAASRDLTTHLGSGNELWQNKLNTGYIARDSGGGQLEITLTEAELNQLIQEDLAQSATAAALLQATEGLQATLEADRLQAGTVVSPANLPINDLPPETQAILQQALTSLPMLENREFYVGIAANPRVENGQLVLGEDTQFQVGSLQFSLAEAARIAGLSPTQLTERMNVFISQSGVTLEDLQIVDGQLILRGTTE